MPSIVYSVLSIAAAALGMAAGFNHQWIIWALCMVIAIGAWWLGRRLIK